MNEVYAREFKEVQAVVNREIKCPDVAAIAMVLIWLYWSRRPNLAISRHIRYGIWHAKSGRDLPGVQASKFRDIWDNAKNHGDLDTADMAAARHPDFRHRGSDDVFNMLANWGGGGMGQLPDPAPGPDRLAEDKESFQVWQETLTDKEAAAAELYKDGLKNMEVAEELGVSPGRATQLRTQMAAKWKALDE